MFLEDNPIHGSMTAPWAIALHQTALKHRVDFEVCHGVSRQGAVLVKRVVGSDDHATRALKSALLADSCVLTPLVEREWLRAVMTKHQLPKTCLLFFGN
jgi:hypothetical protein